MTFSSSNPEDFLKLKCGLFQFNGEDVRGITHSHLVERIKQSNEGFTIKVMTPFRNSSAMLNPNASLPSKRLLIGKSQCHTALIYLKIATHLHLSRKGQLLSRLSQILGLSECRKLEFQKKPLGLIYCFYLEGWSFFSRYHRGGVIVE